VANNDQAVAVDAEAEKEADEHEASRLESEMRKEARAKERDGIAVDGEELPDYDEDESAIAERQAVRREQRATERELRKKLKARSPLAPAPSARS